MKARQARPRLPSLACNRSAALAHTRPGCPLLRLPNLPPAHLPPALPHASDWVPVGRRRVGPAEQPRHGLGWVGRAQICVWSVPAGACGLPPEAAALFLSLSGVHLPFSAVAASSAGPGGSPGRSGVADLGWVGLGGSGRRCLGREAQCNLCREWSCGGDAAAETTKRPAVFGA